MQSLNVLKTYSGKRLADFPNINHANLFARIRANFHFEFIVKGDKLLFSPFYSLLRGGPAKELEHFVAGNEEFLDSLKEFILNSLFIYSSVIDENSYYLSNEKDVFIARLLYRQDAKFEVKFYAHYLDELLSAYEDKIYIGRDFIDLKKFDRDHFGLEDLFISILDQDVKIQERARHKLRYYDNYKKQYLDEISYMAKEASSEACERIKLFPKGDIKHIPTVTLIEIIDNLLYIQNLMIELRDFTEEFETILRAREETGFVRYLTKFHKDMVNDIKYLSKLFYLISLKVSKISLI